MSKDSLAAYTGVDIEALAKAIAPAVRASGKFAKEEHSAVLKALFANNSPESLQANVERIANISAVRQELAAAGLVKAPSVSALATAVGVEIDRLAAAAKADEAKSKAA